VIGVLLGEEARVSAGTGKTRRPAMTAFSGGEVQDLHGARHVPPWRCVGHDGDGLPSMAKPE
jgi:hypothetical protein